MRKEFDPKVKYSIRNIVFTKCELQFFLILDSLGSMPILIIFQMCTTVSFKSVGKVIDNSFNSNIETIFGIFSGSVFTNI